MSKKNSDKSFSNKQSGSTNFIALQTEENHTYLFLWPIEEKDTTPLERAITDFVNDPEMDLDEKLGDILRESIRSFN